MWLANLSELGPNCIRCSFAISSFKLSISVLCETISAYRSAASACFSITRAFNASESRALRSGNSALAAVIDATMTQLQDNTGHNLRYCSIVFGYFPKPTLLACGCALACASRCLLITSITAHASDIRFRLRLAAKQSVHAPAALQTDISRHRPTTAL